MPTTSINPDTYLEVQPSGWLFRFPNRWTPSVIREPNNRFHFELYLGVGADATKFAVDNGGYPDGTIHNLTSERAEEIVRKLAELPTRTTDDTNGA